MGHYYQHGRRLETRTLRMLRQRMHGMLLSLRLRRTMQHGSCRRVDRTGSCLVVCCLNCCCHPMVRCKLVEKYGFEESSVVSCLLACCCGVCSSAQIIQEVESKTSLASTCCGFTAWAPAVACDVQTTTAAAADDKAPGQA